MCGRFALLDWNRIPQHFQAHAADWLTDASPNYNIAPTTQVPIIRSVNGSRTVDSLRWGLVPSWAKDLKYGARMINARAETAPTKSAFKSSWKTRRCLVPASHFYEWRTEGKQKYPHLIRPADGSMFAFAGLWSRWTRGDAPIESFTILTCDAAGGLGDLHDRSPVPLDSSSWARWLSCSTDPNSLRSLMRPVRDVEIVQVSQRVNSVRNNDAGCVIPWSETGFTLQLQ